MPLDGTRAHGAGYDFDVGQFQKAGEQSLRTKTYADLLTERASTVALVVASSVMLSWVALFNHFPLVFPDTLSYATTALLGELPSMFSAYYSIFILPLHQGVHLWPVVFVQGALLGHLLLLVVRCVLGGNVGKPESLLIVAVLCLFSSLPWFTGQIMPDVFSAVVLLGVFLLAFCTNQLTRRELIYIGALTTAGIATHLSHVPIALGLILLCGALQPFFTTTQIGIRRRVALLLLLLLPLILAVCSMLAVNWINSRAIAFARYGNVFLLAKWIEDGPALAYLAQACPTVRYSLCPYVLEMRGMYQDDLKWWGGSPFYKVGGFDQLEPEARSIVWATLRTYPVEILRIAMTSSGQQLLRFDIGEGLSPGAVKLVAPYIADVFGPDVEKSLLRSKQADGRLPVTEFRRLHLAALIFSLVLALWSLIAGRQRIPARLAAVYVFVPVGILWNAVVTGALSGPFDRYLARVSWVICFVALLGFFHVASLRPRERQEEAKAPI